LVRKLSYSKSSDLVRSGNRDSLFEEELRIAQALTVAKQLPIVLLTNIVWALISSVAVRELSPWPLIMASVMTVLLAPVLVIYWRLRRRPDPTITMRGPIRRLTIYLGGLGFFWAISIFLSLPRVPVDTLIFLATGSMLLANGAAAALYVIPRAIAAYSVPIFAIGVYVTATVSQGVWPLVTSMILLAAVGVAWITCANWTNFVSMSRLRAERSQLLADSKAAIIARNQFLENISHEIKTPLTTVLGFTRLLVAEESKMQDEHRDVIGHLDISVISLLATLESLLDVTKLNANQLWIDEGEYEIRELIDQLLSSVRTSAESKGVGVTSNIDVEVPRILVGDASRVRQIIGNLLSNAVKFTHEGRIEVDVGLHRFPGSASKKMLCMTVRDTGIGIDPAKSSSIFRSFYQIDASSTRRHGGMGLGLTVSHMLAKLMGGELDFESDGCSGSIFRCWLPYQPRSLPEPDVVVPDASVPERPLHVLVVDDDIYIRHYLNSLLRNVGWKAELCDSGQSAIDLCSTIRFDLILMDIQMPEMTGIDASKLIRLHGMNRQTPILAITGYLSVDRIAELRAAGLVHYLGKPLVPEELLMKARHSVRAASLPEGASTSSQG
jgi:signal transduction histidine kinase/AmiR/NasT family two-component response regulator